MLSLALTVLSKTVVRSHTSISEWSSGTGHVEDTPAFRHAAWEVCQGVYGIKDIAALTSCPSSSLFHPALPFQNVICHFSPSPLPLPDCSIALLSPGKVILQFVPVMWGNFLLCHFFHE